MTTLSLITSEELVGLKGKNLIVTGGASGIGRATVLIAHTTGVNVAVAGWSKEADKELEAELKERIIFVEIDVSVWESVLVLFETTLSHFGSIDAVYVNTGGAFEEGLLENELDAAGKLKGALDEEYGGQFARGCVHHQGCNLLLREGARENASASFDRLGSKDLYEGYGLLCVRKNITVNIIAPWMTITAQLPYWHKETWGNLPANDPSGVANALLLPIVRPELNGRTISVAGNKTIELEQPLADIQAQWMGAELSAAITEGQVRMGIMNNLV